MTETLFTFTNDDPGMQEPVLFAGLLNSQDEHGVSSAYFVVPNADGQPFDTNDN